jgi:hypothetical protein
MAQNQPSTTPATTPATTTTTAATKAFLGVVFDFDGKEIALEPTTAITELRTKGLECGLKPGERIDFGPVGGRLYGLFEALDMDTATLDSFLDKDTGKLKEGVLPDIEVLNNIINLLLTAQLAIEQFHLKIPPTHRAPNPPRVLTPADKITPPLQTLYTVGLSATWGADGGKLIGNLKLKGVYFKVSNEQ